MKIVVLIVAAGNGARLGSAIPKQYLKISGKSILEHSIEKFKDFETYAVISEKHQHLYNLKTPVIFGGETRADSVRLALNAIKADKVIIHDAARPFISPEIITNFINELKTSKAVIVVSKVADTIKNNKTNKTIPREDLVAAETPQGFDYDIFVKLHEKYQDRAFTDDAELFELENIPVKYLINDLPNFKITTMQDLDRANLMLSKIKIGYGCDTHRFKDGDHIMIGGVKIPHNKGVDAHSDGDVVLHALVDALLGAMGMGDIGEHFPPSDAKWKDADSKIFVNETMKMLHSIGGVINNIDVTIITESPKISGYREAIKESIQELTGMVDVNIKAKTAEKMGAIGRKEGIAANVAVVIRA